jgi:hypothetical protein
MSDSALSDVNSRFLSIALQNAANSTSVIGFVSCCFRSFSSTSYFASSSVTGVPSSVVATLGSNFRTNGMAHPESFLGIGGGGDRGQKEKAAQRGGLL